MSVRPVRGFTLIELVMFIVIAGIAMAALFSVFNLMVGRSADPQIRKQLLAIAESLMDEVQLMPFTFCDPEDANAATANSAAVPGSCASLSEDTPFGPEPGETRYSLSTPFDNVSDYHGFTMNSGIYAITSDTAQVAGLDAYSASISVTQAALSGGADTVPAADSLKITVSVSGPAGLSLTLEGYRTRYAPNTLP